jgi:hypothetical protein
MSDDGSGGSVESGAASDPGLLGIYLNDHLAGATLGTGLASRVAGANRGSDDGATLARIAEEIAEDRSALMDIMAALGVPVRQYKVALAWVAEKAGRFKPNGRVLARSPLSNLEELEAMRLGVEGKSAGWRTLQIVAEHDDRVDRERLDELLDRAKRQAATLEELRSRVATEFATAL